MKAMIFAAGIGSRLKPWTDEHPKALVEVGGMPMLEHVLRKIINAGITDITINIHHFGGQIIEFLESKNYFNVDVKISDEQSLLMDTGGGLLKASSMLGDAEPILVHNADILTDFAIDEMLKYHTRNDADATLLAFPRPSQRCLYFNENSRMCGWGNIKTGETKPPQLDTTHLSPLAFGGVHIINPHSIMPRLESFGRDGLPFSITDFYIRTCEKINIKAYSPAEQFMWFDVGKPETLEKARKTFVNS